VLDVLPGSPAYRLGLRPGAVVLEVYGVPVRSRTAIQALLIGGSRRGHDRLGQDRSEKVERSRMGQDRPGWNRWEQDPSEWDPSERDRPGRARAGQDGDEWLVEQDGRRQHLRIPRDTPLPLGVVFVPEPYDAPLVDLIDRSRYSRIVGAL